MANSPNYEKDFKKYYSDFVVNKRYEGESVRRNLYRFFRQYATDIFNSEIMSNRRYGDYFKDFKIEGDDITPEEKEALIKQKLYQEIDLQKRMEKQENDTKFVIYSNDQRPDNSIEFKIENNVISRLGSGNKDERFAAFSEIIRDYNAQIQSFYAKEERDNSTLSAYGTSAQKKIEYAFNEDAMFIDSQRISAVISAVELIKAERKDSYRISDILNETYNIIDGMNQEEVNLYNEMADQVEVDGRTEYVSNMDKMIYENPSIVQEKKILGYIYNDDGTPKGIELYEDNNEIIQSIQENELTADENKEELLNQYYDIRNRAIVSDLSKHLDDKQYYVDVANVVGVENFRNILYDVSQWQYEQENNKIEVEYFEKNKKDLEKKLNEEDMNELERRILDQTKTKQVTITFQFKGKEKEDIENSNVERQNEMSLDEILDEIEDYIDDKVEEIEQNLDENVKHRIEESLKDKARKITKKIINKTKNVDKSNHSVGDTNTTTNTTHNYYGDEKSKNEQRENDPDQRDYNDADDTKIKYDTSDKNVGDDDKDKIVQNNTDNSSKEKGEEDKDVVVKNYDPEPPKPYTVSEVVEEKSKEKNEEPAYTEEENHPSRNNQIEEIDEKETVKIENEEALEEDGKVTKEKDLDNIKEADSDKKTISSYTTMNVNNGKKDLEEDIADKNNIQNDLSGENKVIEEENYESNIDNIQEVNSNKKSISGFTTMNVAKKQKSLEQDTASINETNLNEENKYVDKQDLNSKIEEVGTDEQNKTQEFEEEANNKYQMPENSISKNFREENEKQVEEVKNNDNSKEATENNVSNFNEKEKLSVDEMQNPEKYRVEIVNERLQYVEKTEEEIKEEQEAAIERKKISHDSGKTRILRINKGKHAKEEKAEHANGVTNFEYDSNHNRGKHSKDGIIRSVANKLFEKSGAKGKEEAYEKFEQNLENPENANINLKEVSEKLEGYKAEKEILDAKVYEVKEFEKNIAEVEKEAKEAEKNGYDSI